MRQVLAAPKDCPQQVDLLDAVHRCRGPTRQIHRPNPFLESSSGCKYPPHSDFQATVKLVPSDVRADGTASSSSLLLTIMIF